MLEFEPFYFDKRTISMLKDMNSILKNFPPLFQAFRELDIDPRELEKMNSNHIKHINLLLSEYGKEE